MLLLDVIGSEFPRNLSAMVEDKNVNTQGLLIIINSKFFATGLKLRGGPRFLLLISIFSLFRLFFYLPFFLPSCESNVRFSLARDRERKHSYLV